MKRLATLLLAPMLSIALSGSAIAGPLCSDCQATYQLFVNGNSVSGGGLRVDDNGNVVLAEPVGFQGEGFSIGLDSLSGNVDPFVIFGIGATNNTDAPLGFAFAFTIPINIGGVIKADASVTYSVTDGRGDGATLFPISGTGKVVDSQDLNSATGLSTDKGVDIGDACSVGPPAGAYLCGPFNASSIFGSVGGPTYDLMSVIVAFGLSPHDAAGLSGLVSQTPVPEPGTLLLLGSGLAGLLTFGRRSA
jgi:hypothetical protein